MALSTVITGFYSVAQLRNATGKPTLDTADPGYVSDHELECIIQRHHDEAVEHARKMAHQLVDQGELPCAKRLFVPITITMSASTNQPALLEGTMADTYYPFAYQVQDNSGNEFMFDPNPGKTVRTSFTRRFVYKTVGRTLYSSPGMDSNPPPTSLIVHLALENDVWDFLFDGEMVRKYNEAILREAITLMDRTIREGLRLETIQSANDQVPGDLT